MSPETYLGPEQMLDSAVQLKELLLPAEVEIQKVAEEERQRRMYEISENYGLRISTEPPIEGLVDTRISAETPVISPANVNAFLPITKKAQQTTKTAREASEQIINGDSDRLIVDIGPCSIHDIESAIQYAQFLKQARDDFGEYLELVMRFHTEKPRTTTGWKGFTYDPMLTEFLDPQNPDPDINLGLILTRMLAIQITNMGVPLGMERLNTLTPQYLNGLITLGATGARNAHDQTSREGMSGSSDVGLIKNAPDGSFNGAIDGLISVRAPHTFLGLNDGGNLAQVTTTGNSESIVVLRGGYDQANYYDHCVNQLMEDLRRRSEQTGIDLPQAIGIDFSHMNSGGDHIAQIEVARYVAARMRAGKYAVKLVMIESNLKSGSQKAEPGMTTADLVPGRSITDNCIGLSQTRDVLAILATAVRAKRAQNS